MYMNIMLVFLPLIFYTKLDNASKKKRGNRYFFTNYYNQMIYKHLVRTLPFPAMISLLVIDQLWVGVINKKIKTLLTFVLLY